MELARAFLTYYLEAAQRIVSGYVELGRRESPAQEVCDTLERAEDSLESIQRAFDQQLAGLLQSEVIDLDSEIELLEKTVEMDDMGKDAARGPRTRGGRHDRRRDRTVDRPGEGHGAERSSRRRARS